MSIRLPVDASQNVQAAFRDVEQELVDLRAAVAALSGGTDLTSITERIDRIPPPPQLNSAEHVFVGAGPQASPGLVPSPGTSGGDTSRVLGESGEWVYQNVQKLSAADQSSAGVADIFTLAGSLHVSGEVSASQVTLGRLNQMNPVFCRLAKSGNTTQGAAAQYNLVLWNTESFDPEGMHSTSSNTGRITIVTSGIYVFATSLTIQQATEGKHVAIYKNGSIVAVSGGPGANNTTEALHVSYMDFSVVGDYYEVFTRFQTTDLTVNVGSWFAAAKVA